IPISTRPIYTTFAWAYDLVVPSPAAPQPEEAARLFAGRRSLVDVGCGTGRHSAALADAGFTVVGIDSAPEMIDVARERLAGAAELAELDFEVADLYSWRPPSPVDGVLCRGVFNDITKDVDRQLGIDSLFSMLREGGLLVFSVGEIDKTRGRFGRGLVVTRSAGGG